ncbi:MULTISPECIES: helix-turn-helix domain-containing protein [Clostridium]|uniref:DNA-binding transcriptional activator FeaR n=3 Tax=Clostridium TaxID=1485 RepID=D8GIX1_CLOLD|nr:MULTISPECIES: helix-turn-helix domain-containing protein [Clostridium]ADK15046.1 predicted transcriptional regulator, AraC family [Clostridium ljungdahlii DSM 13528]AGY74299.1 helix-turn-helix domain-containing protein [Clostridium autoethanogenum DSM 10061]ALU34490.1 Transcriptional regulator AraC family [Clostridium autoethanogenum DSM 10061]OAA87707.1 DNA-binding transcriptional activator FeaR [Clostridium ljungdahlii DSM 13528]OVY51210.1 DNA-binding transcriptional activator FeaR [Clost
MFFNDISVKKHLKIKETPNYIYIEPHPLLRKYIAHYTILFPNPKEMGRCSDNIGDLTLIPDCSGCIIYTYENSDFLLSLWGATTKTVIVKNDVNLKKIRFFIEFVPGGLHAITGIKQSELCDIQTQVDEVDKCLYDSLNHAAEIANNADDMVSMVNRIFLEAVEKNNKQHAVMRSSLEKIKVANGVLTVKELSSSEYVSQRHLNRLFNEYIGINPKMLLRISRINYSINMLKKAENKSYINASQIFGYFDQSHFIHDFKQICGVSPKEFFKNMSDFYNELFKY